MTLSTAGRVRSGLLHNLRSRVRGPVLAPGDEGYDAARAAWNLNAEHRPAAVVRVADVHDIRAAVLVARTLHLGVGVLATGHGTGLACDVGVLISTSALRGVRLDPVSRIARVEARAV